MTELVSQAKSKKRMSNLELLRCLAMMMVVALHYLGKGELLGDLTVSPMSSRGICAWLLEAFCIVAVNVYMLISGYFLCESHFKLSRLVGLWLQVWFYSVVVGFLAAGFGLVPAEEMTTYYYLQVLFPILMGQYWFITAYFFLYLLLPLLATAVGRMTKTQHGAITLVLLFVFSLAKSVLPIRLDMDGKGYDVLWYVCVFMAAAYWRRYGIKPLEKKGKGLLLYLVCTLLVFGEAMALHIVYAKSGSLGLLLTVSTEYNHIFPFLAAFGLFGFFLKVQVPEGIGKAVCAISPYTLGVYLLHENVGVRYAWQKWFAAPDVVAKDSVFGLLLWLAVAVLSVFAAGILVDYLRSRLVGILHFAGMKIKPYQCLVEKITAVDTLFGGKG